jgi:hypothetical protein
LKIIITTEQLENIVGEIFYPPGDRSKREVIIVNSAYGVPKEFYYPFAKFLSANGLTVLTYNYISLSSSLSGGFAIERCGRLDFETILQWVIKFFPGHLIHVVGHGMGGGIIGFAPSCSKIKNIINIGVRSSGQFDRPKNHQLLHFLHYSLLGTANSFINKITDLDPHSLHDKIFSYSNRLVLRARSKDLTKNSLKRAVYAQEFMGRLLTIRLHDDVFSYPENDPIQNAFTRSVKTVRNIYPADLELMHLGFFGFFTKIENDTLWEMCIGWISDTIAVKDYPYAIFDDSEFPVVQIIISDREPAADIMEEYFQNMAFYLNRGPIYILIDLTKVTWADSGMSKYASPWITANRNLIIAMHKYTVYVAPNTFIRYFLIFFHLISFNNIIKPVRIFKEYHAAMQWLRLQVDADAKIPATQFDETSAQTK